MHSKCQYIFITICCFVFLLKLMVLSSQSAIIDRTSWRTTESSVLVATAPYCLAEVENVLSTAFNPVKNSATLIQTRFAVSLPFQLPLSLSCLCFPPRRAHRHLKESLPCRIQCQFSSAVTHSLAAKVSLSKNSSLLRIEPPL